VRLLPAFIQLSSTIQQQTHIVVILPPIYFNLMQELEDKKWFPAFLRNHQTEYLSFLASAFRLYHPIKQKLLDCLQNVPNAEWTDICSGAGGPVKNLATHHKVLLTDKFPHTNIQDNLSGITYHEKPVDVLKDDIPGKGLISMFNGFHHFGHSEKEEILQMAAKSARPIFIAEILQPNLICLLRVIFSATVGHWLLVPVMKPFSLKRVLFTYIIPLHTFTILIDGIISVCKAGSSTYYKKLCKNNSTEQYQLYFECVPSFSSTIYLLYGKALK
jgi:hypothetical protein